MAALNARIRRIDLACKLLGPLVISTIVIASTLAGIWATLGMNIASVVVEYVCIATVSHSVLLGTNVGQKDLFLLMILGVWNGT